MFDKKLRDLVQAAYSASSIGELEPIRAEFEGLVKKMFASGE